MDKDAHTFFLVLSDSLLRRSARGRLNRDHYLQEGVMKDKWDNIYVLPPILVKITIGLYHLFPHYPSF